VRETFTIVTPENVEFEFEIAGFFTRFVAWFIDLIFIAVLAWTFSWIASLLSPLSTGFGSAVFAVGFFGANWGYFVVLEWLLGGQSLGKRALGIRVLSDDGVRITFLQSCVRNLFRILDSLPLIYLVGGGFAFFSAKSQRLGDMAAGTVVIREYKQRVPEAIVPPKERFNSILADRDLAARVSSRLGRVERELLVDLALRRESLRLDQRLLLFEGLSRHLQDRLEIDLPDHFSDEKLCLNIAAMTLGASEGPPVSTSAGLRRL
jgi:uncharacterized RDD family membrane protein YckC